MATLVSSNSPPRPSAQRPRGILKNSYQRSPPVSPTNETANLSLSVEPTSPILHNGSSEQALTLKEAKELTIANTQHNAGHRRSSSSATRSRRQSSRTPSHQGNEEEEETSQRLKWDEANLYLTEQERSSTMKINEPKTPYAKHYDPAEDPSDGEEERIVASGMDLDLDKIDGVKDLPSSKRSAEDEIPGLSLGEPEEAVPDGEFSGPKRPRAVHVDSHGNEEEDDETAGMTPEDKEKHRKFEALRKKHYEMKNAAKYLGHSEELEEEEADDDEEVPAVPGHTDGSA